MKCLPVVLLACCLALPLSAQAEPLWKGWCAGRKAGLEQASKVVHGILDPIKDDAATDPVVKEFLDLLLAVHPFVWFGPSPEEPVTPGSRNRAFCLVDAMQAGASLRAAMYHCGETLQGVIVEHESGQFIQCPAGEVVRPVPQETRPPN